MQNQWLYKRIDYKEVPGFLMASGSEPDEEQLRQALNEIVAAANIGGWTISALTYLPHERILGQAGPLLSGVTIVATLSKP